MPTAAIYSAGSYAQQQSWTQALQNAGYTVLPTPPTTGTVQVALFLGSAALDGQLASNLYAAGVSIVTASPLPAYYSTFVNPLGTWGAFGNCPGLITPFGTSPLSTNWSQVPACSTATLWAGPTTTNAGVTVAGVVGNGQAAILYLQSSAQFWLHVNSDAPLPTGLSQDITNWIGTIIIGPPAPCSPTNPCPAGEVCVNGTCTTPPACSPTQPCPSGYSCVGGTCRPSTTTGCPNAGDVSIFGQCVPWWLLAMLGVGALLLLGGGGRDEPEHRPAAPRHRRQPVHHRAPRVVTRYRTRVVHHTRTVVKPRPVTASEASAILRHQDRVIHPHSPRAGSEP